MSAGPAGVRAADRVGEETLELLEAFPAYTDLIWRRILAIVPIEGRVLEVGCGRGAITRRILGSPAVTALDAVDVERAYLERLGAEVRDPRLKLIASAAEELDPPAGSYDRAVSVNVLEHVADDTAALRSIARALRPGGECALLVPAHPRLYSSLDEGLSHHRRYTRRELAAKLESAGLEPRRIIYFNPLGALGWWLNGKVLRRRALPGRQVAAYARFAIGISSLLDRLNPFPLGISLIARAARPAARVRGAKDGGGGTPLAPRERVPIE